LVIVTTQDKRRVHLRFDYTQLERLSPLAREISAMQSNCDLNMQGIATKMNNCGMGCDLHFYSEALCLALELKNVRVRTIGPWVWKDEKHCQEYDEAINDPWKSPMKCYFPESENLCPEDDAQVDELHLQDPQRTYNLTDANGRTPDNPCPTVVANVGGIPFLRSATAEFLFTRVSTIVQREAQRQLELVFGINGTEGYVPNNLITVHVRWGDKRLETTLLPITTYIDAVHDILHMRANRTAGSINVEESDVNIFLSTEDPDAVKQFIATKPENWKVFVDHYFVEYLPHRPEDGSVYNHHIAAAKEQELGMGLLLLGSLLVGMEANDFVLTTTSNWSRLMNEIRKGVIDPRCGGCTSLIDLSPDPNQ
jgi:hypothetical protein